MYNSKVNKKLNKMHVSFENDNEQAFGKITHKVCLI